jgi:hypothetical protein
VRSTNIGTVHAAEAPRTVERRNSRRVFMGRDSGSWIVDSGW